MLFLVTSEGKAYSELMYSFSRGMQGSEVEKKFPSPACLTG